MRLTPVTRNLLQSCTEMSDATPYGPYSSYIWNRAVRGRKLIAVVVAAAAAAAHHPNFAKMPPLAITGNVLPLLVGWTHLDRLFGEAPE